MQESQESAELPFPEYMKEKYTEYDALNLRAYEDSKEIVLMTYRQCVPSGIPHKGVIFFIHGFGDYCEYEAFIFKMFADKGYECFTMDQRGFGNSGGLRGYQGTAATIYNDVELFIHTALTKHNIDPKVTPIFLMGMSFGGLVTFNMSLKHPNLFKGLTLIVPFFDLKNNGIFKFYWMFKSFEFFNPLITLKKHRYHDPEYYRKYSYVYDDPKRLNFMRIQSLTLFKEQHLYARQNVSKQKTPFLLITAKQDVVVCNDASMKIFNSITHPLNKHLELEDSDHIQMLLEFDKCKGMVDSIIKYFDSLLE